MESILYSVLLTFCILVNAYFADDSVTQTLVSATAAAVHRDYLFVSTINGTLYMVDSLSGEVRSVIHQPAVLEASMSAAGLSFLLDPKSGSLYQLNQGKLRKLPLNIFAFVQASPLRSDDGLLYAGSKQDTWIGLVSDANGSLHAHTLADSSSVICPASGRTAWIGRSQYQMHIVDTKNSYRRWNVSFFDYAWGHLLVQSDYQYDHYTSCSDGLLVTVDNNTRKVIWKQHFDSVVVGVYQLHSNGFRRIDQQVLGRETLDDLLETESISGHRPSWSNSLEKLSPTIYVGQHGSELYAMQSLVNSKTVILSIDKHRLPLLSGPTAILDQVDSDNKRPAEQRRLSLDSLQRYLVSPDEYPNLPVILGYHEMPPMVELSLYTAAAVHLPSHLLSISYDADVKQSAKATSQQTFTYLGVVLGLSLFAILFVRAQFVVRLSNMILRYGRCWLRRCHLANAHSSGISVGRIWFCPLQLLGRGSDGTAVFRGTYDGRPVAVKRVIKDFYNAVSREVNLLRETDSHPNVVRYFCMESDQHFCYIALQLCQLTVQDYVETHGSGIHLEPRQLLLETTHGLAHLHRLGVVHRDLKPQNVLICCSSNGAKPVAMLSDFGLGKQVDSTGLIRPSGTANGTEGWIAPEVFQGEVISFASDVFSLGCIYFYVLTKGKHPFGSDLLQQKIAKGDCSEFYRTALAAEDRDLINAMIASKPDSRPSAQQVLRHPFHWSNSKRLGFLQEISNRVDKAGPESAIVKLLESSAFVVVGSNWRNRICHHLQQDLRKFRTYRSRSVCDLLRALRNKRHHYHELPDEVRQSLGTIPDDFLAYFSSRFPLLLMHVYKAGQLLHEEHSFSRYYA